MYLDSRRQLLYIIYSQTHLCEATSPLLNSSSDVVFSFFVVAFLVAAGVCTFAGKGVALSGLFFIRHNVEKKEHSVAGGSYAFQMIWRVDPFKCCFVREKRDGVTAAQSPQDETSGTFENERAPEARRSKAPFGIKLEEGY